MLYKHSEFDPLNILNLTNFGIRCLNDNYSLSGYYFTRVSGFSSKKVRPLYTILCCKVVRQAPRQLRMNSRNSQNSLRKLLLLRDRKWCM